MASARTKLLGIFSTYGFEPPYDEQVAMADYLEAKVEEVDAVISDKKEQLATLDEYKKSLIFEYVTGKKEVV